MFVAAKRIKESQSPKCSWTFCLSTWTQHRFSVCGHVCSACVRCVCLGALGEMVSDSGSCLCLYCDAGVILQAQHGTKASLARPSQLNNNHASQANSSRHVVNGLGYTSWRPAEACPLRGRIANTSSLELRQLHGKGTGWTVQTEEDRDFSSHSGVLWVWGLDGAWKFRMVCF